MMKFYDSDLASDNPVNIHSDHEPPKDKIKDKKLLKKTELKRFHKIIMKTGSSLPKPAKYDEVSYRLMEAKNIQEKEDEENFDILIKSDILKTNLGLNNKEEWFDIAVESMKKDEIAMILIENLKYDGNKLKILERTDYYYVQLITWTTVIDLDANFNYMKKLVNKGHGLDRCELCDEVSFTYKILFNDTLVFEKSYENEVKLEKIHNIENEDEKLDSNILKILKTMKPTEHCICHIKFPAFESLSSNQLILETLNKKISASDVSKESSFIDIEVKIFSIIKIDDLFHDHSALKRELRKGRTTSKPESNSMMYFDMQIRVNSNLIYDSWQKKDPEYKVLSFPTNFEEEKEEDFNFLTNNLKCLCIFLDEFRFSKVLKTALKRTKKGEIAEIICTDMTLVNKGIDKEVVDTLTEKPNQLRYLIKLYNFVEGKNSFTMSLDEKIENAKRKKQIGLDLIKKNQYKRALKSFENINSYFELGTFSKEDMLEIKNWKLSSLLNTTFCQMKMNKWKEVILVADKILEYDENNCKATYRRALAYKETLEYEKAFNSINVFYKKNEQNLDEESKKELLTLNKVIEKLLISYKNKEKKMFTQMFSVPDENNY